MATKGAGLEGAGRGMSRLGWWPRCSMPWWPPPLSPMGTRPSLPIRALSDFSGLPIPTTMQGLQSVQAPGEAEAVCGALNEAGIVDAVATVDGDALLFGASVVYKELSLCFQNPKMCAMSRCVGRCQSPPAPTPGPLKRDCRLEMGKVRRKIGCCSGGGDALIAIAALSGGDYNEGYPPPPSSHTPPLPPPRQPRRCPRFSACCVAYMHTCIGVAVRITPPFCRGARGIGIEKAVKLVSSLMEERSDDTGILPALLERLAAAPDENMAALSSKGCTGCKACGAPPPTWLLIIVLFQAPSVRPRCLVVVFRPCLLCSATFRTFVILPAFVLPDQPSGSINGNTFPNLIS